MASSRNWTTTVAFAVGVTTGYVFKCCVEKIQKNKRLLPPAAADDDDHHDRIKTKAMGKAIYSFDVSVDRSVLPEFNTWIRAHAKKLVNMPGFISAEWFQHSVLEKPTVIFVLGGPGAGKGTQCQRIVDEYDYAHISAGDCLRGERNSKSKDAQLINQYIQEGKIVPVEITVRLLKKAMDASEKKKFLIDGFPRNLNNVNGWFDVIGHSVDVAFVLFLDCPEHIMEQRLLKRGKTSGRVDDNMDSIKKRFNTYTEETKPIIDFFAAQGKVRHVMADASVDDVWHRVDQFIQEIERPPKTEQLTIQYRLKSRQDLERYIIEDAPRLQAQDQEVFQGKLKISRAYLDSLAYIGK